jgi:hypothetical protein
MPEPHPVRIEHIGFAVLSYLRNVTAPGHFSAISGTTSLQPLLQQHRTNRRLQPRDCAEYNATPTISMATSALSGRPDRQWRDQGTKAYD